MSGILFKHASRTALHAALHLSRPADHGAGPALAEPDPRDVENLALREEVERLRQQISALQADWQKGLTAARARAKQEAAQEHVRDDRRAAEALEAALRSAAGRFEQTLADQVQPLATALAARSIDRLVSLSADETEWLSRVIERRLEEVAKSSLLAIHVAPDAGGGMIEPALEKYTARGIAVTVDPTLPAGTARIALTLGEIDIEPGRGAAAMIGLLDEAAAGHG